MELTLEQSLDLLDTLLSDHRSTLYNCTDDGYAKIDRDTAKYYAALYRLRVLLDGDNIISPTNG